MKKAVEIQAESQAFVCTVGRVTPEKFDEFYGSPELIEGFRKFCEEYLKKRIEAEEDSKAVVKSKVFVREIEVEDGEELVGE
ncbi:MAG: hypothetical protein IJ386_01670 [Clostridia bacterium]|nr:hypothetical protein [Clostridia bacterium]